MLQITPSDVLKLIGTLTAAEIPYSLKGSPASDTLLRVHESVEKYLGTKIEFEIKPDLFYAGSPGEPI